MWESQSQRNIVVSRGRVCAIAGGVAGVGRFEDLDAWKLSSELRDRIFALTEAGPWARNLDFRDQIRDASSSPPRNIAEGFGRFRPTEFAYFVRIARASLAETRNHLHDARTKRYVSEKEADELLVLTNRCLGATTNFLRYLQSCNDTDSAPWNRSRRPKRKG